MYALASMSIFGLARLCIYVVQNLPHRDIVYIEIRLPNGKGVQLPHNEV